MSVVGGDVAGKYRVGRKLGRTLYWQPDVDPSDGDDCIGMVDESYIAKQIVQALNGAGEVRKLHQRKVIPDRVTPWPYCTHCGVTWPCSTMIALDGPEVVITKAGG